jgi:hypothetical protein
VTATPQLAFYPGETGASPVSCEGAGDRYDPKRDLFEQAKGACAYTYTKRTGIPGRPKAWPGQAVVTWNITWAATNGDGGALPTVRKTAAAPKSVVEIQAVLTN